MEWIADPTVWIDLLPARGSVLEALTPFKRTTAELALVVEDQGQFQGLATRADLPEAIAGGFSGEARAAT